jgi:flavin-dependent dehydrogenase
MTPQVIVVGAGVAGLCAAYRLAQTGLRAKIPNDQRRPKLRSA